MKHQLRIRLTLALTVLLILAGNSMSQDDKSVILTGTVTDKFGSLLVGAQVVVKSGKLETARVKVDGRGNYTIRLKPGIYSLVFKQHPFEDAVFERYQLNQTGKMSLDVSLICDGCVELSLPAEDLGIEKRIESGCDITISERYFLFGGRTLGRMSAAPTTSSAAAAATPPSPGGELLI